MFSDMQDASVLYLLQVPKNPNHSLHGSAELL